MAETVRKPPVTITGIAATSFYRLGEGQEIGFALARALSRRPSSPSSLTATPITFGLLQRATGQLEQIEPGVAAASLPTNSTHSAWVKAPFWKSDALSLIPTGKSCPTVALTAASVLIRKRARLATNHPRRPSACWYAG